MDVKNSVGKPLKFKSVEELQSKIDEYFAICAPHIEQRESVNKDGDVITTNYVTEQVPLTITGLALHLDTNRQTLLNYEEKEEYFDTIKRAKARIENYVETYLFQGKNQAAAIFNLVNNYNWENKTKNDSEVRLSTSKEDLDKANRVISILNGDQQK